MMGCITDHTIVAPKWKKGNMGFGATLLVGTQPSALFIWKLGSFLFSVSLRDDNT